MFCSEETGSRVLPLPAMLSIPEWYCRTVAGVGNELLDCVRLQNCGKRLNTLVFLAALLLHRHIHISLGCSGGAGFISNRIMGNGKEWRHGDGNSLFLIEFQGIQAQKNRGIQKLPGKWRYDIP